MNIKNIAQSISNAAQQNDTARKAEEVGTQNTKNPSPAQEQSKALSTVSADKVTLTTTSQQAKALEKKMDEARIDNSEKIKALKLAIEKGDYKIDPDAIAKKLMQTEFAFAQKTT